MAARITAPLHARVCNRLRRCRILHSVTAGALRMVVVAALLVCVLAIVISPFVDLPATALRARAAALLCLLAIMAVAFFAAGIQTFSFDPAPERCAIAPPAVVSPDVTCSWLC